MNIKKIIISFVFVLTLFSVSAYAKTLEFSIGKDVVNVKESHSITEESLLAAPYIENGRTMVPVRVISEKMGAKVGWNEAEQKVTITQNGKQIVLTIGSLDADVGGEATTLDSAPVIKNGVTLVPVRFVSEKLGYDVEYVAATKQVIVTNYPHIATVGETKIDYDTFEIYYDIYLNSYSGVYTEEQIAQMVLTYLRDLYALYDESIRFGITISDEDYEQITLTVAEDMEVAPSGWLKSVYASINTKLVAVDTYCKYISRIVSQADIDEEEYYYNNYMAAKHVYIKKDTENAKKLAMDIAGKASRGTDFDVLMERYSQDYPSKDVIEYGYVFTKGEMPEEFEAAVRKLDVGEVSVVVESGTGYYIIKRMPLVEYSTEFNGIIRTNAAEQSYNNYINSVAENNLYKENVDLSQIMQILAE